MKTKISYFITLAVAFIVSATQKLFAEIKIDNLEQQLSQVPQETKKIMNPIFDIVLMAIGIAAIGTLIYAYIQKRRQDNTGSNDKIIDVAWTTFIVVAIVYVIKAIFF